MQPFGRTRYEPTNWGVCPFGGELGPHLTQCGQGQGLPACQVSSWSIQPFGHNTPTSQTGIQVRTGQRTDSIVRTDLQTVAQKWLPWQCQLPLEPQNRLCLHQIAWSRKPTPGIKQRFASYHVTEVIARRKPKSGCHGNIPCVQDINNICYLSADHTSPLYNQLPRGFEWSADRMQILLILCT